MDALLDIAGDIPHAALLGRMALIAVFVMAVALLSERIGPFLGAMLASLPIYTGPVYALLALEHPPEYLAQAAVGSLAICAATPVFALTYCLFARTRGMALSLTAALSVWFAFAALIQANTWTLVEAALFATPIYVVAVPLARGFTRSITFQRAERRWIDLPLRALLVAGVAALVTAAAGYMPAQLTGILGVMPTVTTSLILVLHNRIGGPATAALLAHSLSGLIGMALAFVLVNLTVRELGPWPSLSMALALCVGWNIMLVVLRHGFAWFRRSASTPANHRARSTAPTRAMRPQR